MFLITIATSMMRSYRCLSRQMGASMIHIGVES